MDNTGPHAGTLDSYLSDININYGLTDRWNLGMNMIIGKRTMHFPQEANIHHRDESRLGIGDLGINLRHISSNISFGPGTRLFFGGGILKFTFAPKQNKYSFLSGYQIDGIAIFYWQTKQIFKGIPQFALIGQKRGVDYWNGVSAPNSGGFVINGSAGLMWNLGQQHITLSVRVPLYKALNMVNEGSSVDNHADMWGFSVSYRTVLSFGD